MGSSRQPELESQADLKTVLEIKHHFESLTTYQEKLDWFFYKYPHLHGGMVVFTLSEDELRLLSADDINSFSVSKTETGKIVGNFGIGVPLPSSHDEHRMYADKLLKHLRADTVGKKVYKIKQGILRGDANSVAFTVTSIDDLKTDLEKQLAYQPNDSLKKQLLEYRLEEVTCAIDSCAPDSDCPHFFSINYMRKILLLGDTYDILYVMEMHPNRWDGVAYILLELAYVWDIVHFERHLKVALTNFEHGIFNKSQDQLIDTFNHIEGDQQQKNSSKPDRKQRNSTGKRHKEYNESVNNFMLLEGKDRAEAIKAAAEKHGCHTDTIERAMGFRK